MRTANGSIFIKQYLEIYLMTLLEKLVRKIAEKTLGGVPKQIFITTGDEEHLKEEVRFEASTHVIHEMLKTFYGEDDLEALNKRLEGAFKFYKGYVEQTEEKVDEDVLEDLFLESISKEICLVLSEMTLRTVDQGINPALSSKSEELAIEKSTDAQKRALAFLIIVLIVLAIGAVIISSGILGTSLQDTESVIALIVIGAVAIISVIVGAARIKKLDNEAVKKLQNIRKSLQDSLPKEVLQKFRYGYVGRPNDEIPDPFQVLMQDNTETLKRGIETTLTMSSIKNRVNRDNLEKLLFSIKDSTSFNEKVMSVLIDFLYPYSIAGDVKKILMQPVQVTSDRTYVEKNYFGKDYRKHQDQYYGNINIQIDHDSSQDDEDKEEEKTTGLARNLRRYQRVSTISLVGPDEHGDGRKSSRYQPFRGTIRGDDSSSESDVSKLADQDSKSESD